MKVQSSYHHGNLRKALIQAALEILDEQGIESLGVRQVARKVGVAHSAPANHFKNKQALFTSLACEIFAELVEILEQEQKPDEEDLEHLLHLIAETIIQYGLRFPNRYRLLWRRDCLDNENRALNEVMEKIYKVLTDTLLVHAKKQGADVESLAIAFWSMIHGYLALRLDGNIVAGQDGQTGEPRQKAIVDVMLKGLTP